MTTKWVLGCIMLLAGSAFAESRILDQVSDDPNVYDATGRHYETMVFHTPDNKACHTAALEAVRNPSIAFGGKRIWPYRAHFLGNFKYCDPINGDEAKVKAIHFAIPPAFALKYGLFVERSAIGFESLYNLRGIGDLEIAEKLKDEWRRFEASFSSAGRKPTDKDALVFAVKMDIMYGKHFLPPIIHK